MGTVVFAKATAVGGFFLCLGSVQLILAWRNLTLARRSRTWPSVPGQISASYPHGDFRRGRLLKASYRYRVNNFPCSGSRIAFGDNWEPTSRIEDLHHRYPFGATVTVYYDPRDPRRSALEPRSVDLGWSCLKGASCLRTAIWSWRSRCVVRLPSSPGLYPLPKG